MKMKFKSLLFPLMTLVSSLAAAQPTIHWSYEGQGSPENWGKLNGAWETCGKGVFQSPIDIQNTVEAHLPPLALNFEPYSGSIINNGHTIQITVHDDDKFTLDNKPFQLKQFHFHTPSENKITGRTFPMEAHFVYADADGGLAVVAVMLVTGKENPDIETILLDVPNEVNQERPLKKIINLYNLFPQDKHYYRYSGSLTTPPCTEGITWLVMKNPVELSEKQLSHFQQALKHANNRPVQPLSGRLIVE